MKTLTPGLMAALLAGIVLPQAALADDHAVWRAFIADHAEPLVSIVDLESGDVIETVTTHAPTALYATSSGQTVFAVQGAANVVEAIASGIEIEDHGDHGDLHVEDPHLLALHVEGEKPSHFVEHHGHIALFFDGDGLVRVLNEADLDGAAAPLEIDSGAPHHGVAVAYRNHVLVSEPHPEDPSNLPVGMTLYDRSGQQVGDTQACPDIHGEASSGNLLAIACATGLLLVNETAEGPQVVHLPYDPALPEGKSTTLLGGIGIQYFLGNYGADRVVVIDPAEETFTLVDLPTRRVHFAADPVRPQFAYIFTEDGNLHRLNILSGQIVATLPLTAPYSMDGHWSDPRPRIAVAGDEILVTDPLESRVHRVDAASFSVSGTLDVEGRPFNIVVVGGSGHAH